MPLGLARKNYTIHKNEDVSLFDMYRPTLYLENFINIMQFHLPCVLNCGSRQASENQMKNLDN